MHKFALKDTVLLSGWLFADLLLGLMVVFLVSIPGFKPDPPPTFTVSTTLLTSDSSNCKGKKEDFYQCSIQIGETAESTGKVDWQVSTDMTRATIIFSPQKGTLKPGARQTVTISKIPCQTGTFIVTGSHKAQPITILWQCTPDPLTLDWKPRHLHWSVTDVEKLLSDDREVVEEVQRQARRDLKSYHVGLIIVYGGAPASASDSELDIANRVSKKTYAILSEMSSSFAPLRDVRTYDDLHTQAPGFTSSNEIKVDVFIFTG